MKDVEKRTEAIAKELCRERKMPVAMAELMLHEAYQLVYFGDKKELARIETRINDRLSRAGKVTK